MPSRSLAGATGAALLALSLAIPAGAQSIAVDRRRGEQMLDQLREDLVEQYYDRTFHGLDLDGLVDRARQRINAAQSLGEIFGLLAGVCLDLHDSHTQFIPPQRVQDVDYGWSWRYVGDRPLVDVVDDDSDAHAKGLHAGDTVVEVAGYTLTRANHGTIGYLLRSLRPQPTLTVVVERNGTRRTLTMASKIKKLRPRLDVENALDRYAAEMQQAFAEAARPKSRQDWLADGVLYWKLADFFDDPGAVKKQGDRLREARAVVLDLRDNPGGQLGAMLQIAGLFAPTGTHVVTVVGRSDTNKLIIDTPRAPFDGHVLVLVDSSSGSCAEMLARFLQSRKARVVGDRTAGAVTGARTFLHAAGEGDIKVFYATRVTIYDILMPDGARLEGAGVTPDVLSLPSPDDLEQGRDPVLAKVAADFGVTLDPQKAARLSRQ